MSASAVSATAPQPKVMERESTSQSQKKVKDDPRVSIVVNASNRAISSAAAAAADAENAAPITGATVTLRSDEYTALRDIRERYERIVKIAVESQNLKSAGAQKGFKSILEVANVAPKTLITGDKSKEDLARESSLAALPAEIKTLVQNEDKDGLMRAVCKEPEHLKVVLKFLISHEKFDVIPLLLVKLGDAKFSVERLRETENSILADLLDCPEEQRMRGLASLIQHFKSEAIKLYNNYEEDSKACYAGEDRVLNRMFRLGELYILLVNIHTSGKQKLESLDDEIERRVKEKLDKSILIQVAEKIERPLDTLELDCDLYDSTTKSLEAQRDNLQTLVSDAELKLDGYNTHLKKYIKTVEDQKPATLCSFISRSLTERFNSDLLQAYLADTNAYLASKKKGLSLPPYVRYVDKNPPVMDNKSIMNLFKEVAQEFEPLRLAMRAARKNVPEITVNLDAAAKSDKESAAPVKEKDLVAFGKTIITFFRMHNHLVELMDPINRRLLSADKYAKLVETQKPLSMAEIHRESVRTGRSTGEISGDDKKVQIKCQAAIDFIKQHQANWLALQASLKNEEEFLKFLVDTYATGGIDPRDCFMAPKKADSLPELKLPEIKKLSSESPAELWNC